jgi:bifunctional DNA-binding transcriptional regulator/antitoxin component of YhaV-PrlF toxin-antitoxin module
MKKANIDVPVLLIFFCRPECFKQVFEQVKIARPSKLFLYQDGARPDKPSDIDNIKQCRTIAEDIDWDCEIHKFYQEKNIGCDPSVFIAIKWMFEHVDRGIILEDDNVPSQSFFPFCDELLEKYKDDERINMIQGLNHLGVYKKNINADDYFFTNAGAIWGWATWKRCTDLWQEHYDFLDDDELVKKIGDQYTNKRVFKQFINSCKWHKESGKAYFETISGATRRLNAQFAIAPNKNLITNIGLTEDAAHNSGGSINMIPKEVRIVFEAKRYELEFPMEHPKEIKIVDYEYEESAWRIHFPSKIRAFYRTQESRFLKLFCTGTEGRKILKESLKRRFILRQ